MIQNWGPVVVIMIGFLLGLYVQIRQVESLRNEMNAKFDTARAETAKGFAELRLEMHTLISGLDHRVERIEERLQLVQK